MELVRDVEPHLMLRKLGQQVKERLGQVARVVRRLLKELSLRPRPESYRVAVLVLELELELGPRMTSSRQSARPHGHRD